MRPIVNIMGQKFNRLTVIQFVGQGKGGRAFWRCRCDCGKEVVVAGTNLRKGTTRSCGCYAQEVRQSNGRKGIANLKHGKCYTRLFVRWTGMKERCYNQNHGNYKFYGGRGIIVCEEWKNDFQAFYDWAMANGYSDDLTLDRIDINGNYEPSNCRWVSWTTQQNNRRTNHYITYNNETHTIAEWSRILNIPYSCLCARLSSPRWTIEKAFTTKVKTRKKTE